MTDPSNSKSRDQIFDVTINVVIRIGLLLLIGFVSLFVIAPFLTVLLWSVILAVTLFPVYQWLTARFGGRGGIASTLIVLVGLTITLGPASLLVASSIDGLHILEDGLADGSIVMPPPPQGIDEWPFIGRELASFWWLAATNLQSALVEV